MEIVQSGGISAWFLGLISLICWCVIFERWWVLKKLDRHLKTFHLEVMNALIQKEWESAKRLCTLKKDLPTAELLLFAFERLFSQDPQMREQWEDACERRRQLVNLEIRKNIWILGTIATASPFVGLFGTVVGILKSFGEMAEKGVGGFSIVAAGISESLIATACGICVAVIAVVAYNAFQTRCSRIILMVRLYVEEMQEVISTKWKAPIVPV